MGSQVAIEKYVIEVIKKKRQENNISQAELARRLGVSLGFIGNVENHAYRAKYNLKHLNELAKIFKCSPKDFMPEKSV